MLAAGTVQFTNFGASHNDSLFLINSKQVFLQVGGPLPCSAAWTQALPPSSPAVLQPRCPGC